MKSSNPHRLLSLAVVTVATLSLSLSAAAAEKWTASSWQRDVKEEAARVVAERPAAWQRLLKLEGLDARRYLQKRRPDPEVTRELSRLIKNDEVPAVLVASLLLDGVDRYPFSTVAELPERYKGSHTQLVAMERSQLIDGLLLSLGSSGHPSAPFVAAHYLEDNKLAVGPRRVAAIALGRTRSAHALTLLTRLAADDKSARELREAALQGLGQARTPAALDALIERLKVRDDKELLRVTIVSIGQASSSWALAREPRELAESMRHKATSALVDVIADPSVDDGIARAAATSLTLVAHDSAVERLRHARASAANDAVAGRLDSASSGLQRALSRSR